MFACQCSLSEREEETRRVEPLFTFVGVGKYFVPDIRDLVGCTRDAIALHALFADTLPDANPKLLIDRDATAANIRHSMQDILGAATPEDVVVFSFSGHGSPDHRLACVARQPQARDGNRGKKMVGFASSGNF